AEAAAQRFQEMIARLSGDEAGRNIFSAEMAVVEGHPDLAVLNAAIDASLAKGFRDPEGIFYYALCLARAGGHDRAVTLLADVVDRGFFPYQPFARHTWLDPLRDRDAFKAVLRTAERRQHEARAALVQ